ncbi:hypothetical protein P7C70_g2729, partial [Phenoliferia sp. Uapishka_3]
MLLTPKAKVEVSIKGLALWSPTVYLNVVREPTLFTSHSQRQQEKFKACAVHPIQAQQQSSADPLPVARPGPVVTRHLPTSSPLAMATINHLPPEILSLVFSSYPPTQRRASDLFYAALVCREWCDLALAELYLDLKLYSSSLERFCGSPRSARNFITRRLWVQSSSRASIALIFERCRGMRELILFARGDVVHDVDWGILDRPSLASKDPFRLSSVPRANDYSFVCLDLDILTVDLDLLPSPHSPAKLPFQLSSLSVVPTYGRSPPDPSFIHACFSALSRSPTSLDVGGNGTGESFFPQFSLLPHFPMIRNSLVTFEFNVEIVSLSMRADIDVTPFLDILPTFNNLSTIILDFENCYGDLTADMDEVDEVNGVALLVIAEYLPTHLKKIRLVNHVLGHLPHIKKFTSHRRFAGIEEFDTVEDEFRARDWCGSEQEQVALRAELVKLYKTAGEEL